MCYILLILLVIFYLFDFIDIFQPPFLCVRLAIAMATS